jgi:hypothetical protein
VKRRVLCLIILVWQTGGLPQSRLNDSNLSGTHFNSPGGAASPSFSGTRIESFSGEIIVTTIGGRQVPLKAGMVLQTGDEVQTLGSAQSEIIIGSAARIVCDEFSDIILDSTESGLIGGSNLTIRQKSGSCWYKIGQSDATGEFRIMTPVAWVSAGGTATDFLLDVQTDRISLSCIGGTVHAEKNGNIESVNLQSGQTIVAFADGRPFQLARSAPDLGVAERTMQTARGVPSVTTETGSGKGKLRDKADQPFTMLICGPPYFFGVACLQPDRGVVCIVQIPSNLHVEEYVQGIETLNQAYNYGGAPLVASLLEPLFEVPLVKYCVFTRAIAGQIANQIGSGIAIPGNDTINNGSGGLMRYLPTEIPPSEDDQRRIEAVVDAFFDNLKDQKITLTMPMVQELLRSMKTNIDAGELMTWYARFRAETGWTRRNLVLPTIEKREEGRLFNDPDEIRCRQLLNSN